ATTAVRTLENLKLRTEAQLAAAETALGSAVVPERKLRAQDAVTKLAVRIEELQAQLSAAQSELQPKLDAVAPAREAAAAAEAARAAAAETARELARSLEPVSVFISRKTQRLYVRRAFQPVLEIPLTIAEPDRPIGTHVFTAMERTNGDGGRRGGAAPGKGGRTHGRAAGADASAGGGSAVEPMATEPSGAKAALDRITIPKDVLDRIGETASPRSSLIISDEELS